MRASTAGRALVALTLGLSTPSSAQNDTTSSTRPRLCWRGKPAPACSTFWITEFGIDASMSSTRSVVGESVEPGYATRYGVRDFDSRFVWTVGPMFNDKRRHAVGGTISFSPLSGNYRAAIEARRRWWTSDELAFDLSAGGLRMDVQTASGPHDRTEYGLTAGAFMVGGDLINVNGRVDLLVTGRKARAGTSIGVGGGSYVAAMGTLALGALVLILLSAGPWD